MSAFVTPLVTPMHLLVCRIKGRFVKAEELHLYSQGLLPGQNGHQAEPCVGHRRSRARGQIASREHPARGDNWSRRQSHGQPDSVQCASDLSCVPSTGLNATLRGARKRLAYVARAVQLRLLQAGICQQRPHYLGHHQCFADQKS